jgi:hypothetical protein
MKKEGLAPPSATRNWTRIEAYLRPMRRPKPRVLLPSRTQPEKPSVLLTTLPFAALLVGFFIMSITIAFAAWPGSQQEIAAPIPRGHETGFVPKGWLQEAQRDFHRQ